MSANSRQRPSSSSCWRYLKPSCSNREARASAGFTSDFFFVWAKEIHSVREGVVMDPLSVLGSNLLGWYSQACLRSRS